MVERPADVLKMDKAEPVKQSGWGRLDATLRRTPGLGFFVVLTVLMFLRDRGDWFAMLGFGAFVLMALADEYGPDIKRRFTSKPHVAPAAPSA